MFSQVFNVCSLDSFSFLLCLEASLTLRNRNLGAEGKHQGHFFVRGVLNLPDHNDLYLQHQKHSIWSPRVFGCSSMRSD